MQESQPTFWPCLPDPHELLANAKAGRATDVYLNDQEIFCQGERAASVFFIQKGTVRVTVTSEHDREAVIAILKEGQFFGEGCLHGQLVRTATATALGECRITSVTKAAMLSAIRDEPKFSRLFTDPVGTQT